MFLISDCEFLVSKTDSLIQRFSSFEKEIPKIVLKFMNQGLWCRVFLGANDSTLT